MPAIYLLRAGKNPPRIMVRLPWHALPRGVKGTEPAPDQAASMLNSRMAVPLAVAARSVSVRERIDDEQARIRIRRTVDSFA
jgi:hypothetical protein